MKKNIFIVTFIPRTVGDPIILTPIFKILKVLYPEHRIIVTATNTYESVFRLNPYVDEVYFIPELHQIGDKSLSKLKKLKLFLVFYLKLIHKINKSNVDLLFVFPPFTLFSQILPIFCNCKKTIGFELTDKESVEYPFSHFSFFDVKVPHIETYSKDEKKHIIHLKENNFNLIRAARPDVIIDSDKFNSIFFITEDNLKKVRKILRDNYCILSTEKIISFHLFSKKEIKNWPLEYYGRLIILLHHKDPSYRFFLLGSAGEHQEAQKVIEYLLKISKKYEPLVFNVCGLFSLEESAALLKNSKLFIGNDSGLAHLSSSVGTTTMVIFGATSPLKALPFGKGKTVAIYSGKKAPLLNLRKNTPNNLKIMHKLSVKEAFKKMIPYLP